MVKTIVFGKIVTFSYILGLCCLDIDECASQPCQHGGICINKINKFVCACINGFYGQFCEKGENVYIVKT